MSAQGSALPSRSGTVMTKSSTLRDSDDDAIPSEDTSEVTKLFQERLKAWRHAVTYLEEYVTATEKLHHGQGKDYEKVLKTVSNPLKEGHHFDQSLGGVAGFFDNLRSNTQGIANSHNETARSLKGSVLPQFERLKNEIKNKTKELNKGAGKGSKAVDKARTATQKHIELLGSHTATYDSTGGKVSAAEDPYVLQRGVRHRLNRQIVEENANRQDLLAVQNNFASFEAHIIQTVQTGLGQFNTIITKQADLTKSMYGDVIANAQRVPADYEWNGFLQRNAGVLINPDAPPRDVNNVSFANQGHRATEPLIAGSLTRRSKVLRRYETGYYVVTPSKFLHEFKTDDDFAKEPVPEVSLFLPDCVVGQVEGEKFTVKGKDSSKGTLGISIHTSHEYNFKAHTAADAQQWWNIIRSSAGQVTNEPPPASLPVSPVSATQSNEEKFASLSPTGTTHQQETGTTGSTAATGAVAGAAAGTAAGTEHAAQTTSPTTAGTTASPTALTAGEQTTGTTGTSASAQTHPAAGTSSTAAPTTSTADAKAVEAGHAPASSTAGTAGAGGPVTTSAGPGESISTAPAKV